MVIYKTKFNKPIKEGQEYYSVLKNGSVIKSVASRNTEEDPNVLERFLTTAGASKLAKTIISQPTKKVEKTPSEEELNEKRLKEMNILSQLDEVENQSDFDKWLKRNDLTITPVTNPSYTNNSVGINIKGNNNDNPNGFLIWFYWVIGGNFGCCGAREQKSHAGGIHTSHSPYLTVKRLEVISKYLVNLFEEKLRLQANNYGIVSYVVNPGAIQEPSARLGFLLEASKCFQKAGRFKNPNTKRWLDIYTVSDEWAQNK